MKLRVGVVSSPSFKTAKRAAKKITPPPVQSPVKRLAKKGAVPPPTMSSPNTTKAPPKVPAKRAATAIKPPRKLAKKTAQPMIYSPRYKR